MPRSTSDRPFARVGLLGALLAIASTACSSGPQLDMELARGEVGCVVAYGVSEPVGVGPIRPTRSTTTALADDSFIEVANSKSALHITVVRGNAERSVTVDHGDIPSSGFTTEDAWIDSDHLGYTVTCHVG